MNILREPVEISYLREQETRERQADQQEEAWNFDRINLEEICRTWGTEQIVKALAEIHGRLQPGTKLQWAILSQAYLSGGYDDPNPCSCDEF